MTLRYDSNGACPHQIRRSDISVRNGTEMDLNSDTKDSSQFVCVSSNMMQRRNWLSRHQPWRWTSVQYCPFSSQVSACRRGCHQLVSRSVMGKAKIKHWQTLANKEKLIQKKDKRFNSHYRRTNYRPRPRMTTT